MGPDLRIFGRSQKPLNRRSLWCPQVPAGEQRWPTEGATPLFPEWQGTTVDEVLTRELEGVASAYSSDLAGAVPDFRLAMRWPARGAETAG